MLYRSLLRSTFCTLLVFGLVHAQAPNGRERTPMRQNMLRQLNLSDTQKKQIEDMSTDFAKQRVQQQAKIKTAAIDLHHLMSADSPDKSAIENKINEIGDLQAQNRMLRVDHWFAVNSLLNPDQQNTWKTALAERLRTGIAARMHEMRDRMMGPHNRPDGPDNPME